jgi:hypothetical protein
MRKPFDEHIEVLELVNSRGDWTPLELLLAGVQGFDATTRAMLCEAVMG